MFTSLPGQSDIRYEPGEKCPNLVAIFSALQIFVPNTIGLVMIAALVVRVSGQPDNYLSWATFTVLIVTGASMIFQTLRLRYLGAGHLVVANFNVPFLVVSVLALLVGGPGLLASLVVVSTLVQVVCTLRLASLRRVFTQTVSGVVVMLVAVSAVPFIISRSVIAPEGVAVEMFLVPGIAALLVGVLLTLKEGAVWRMWVLPAAVAVGLVVAVPLGHYDTEIIVNTPWFKLPELEWHGLGLNFGADFWALLPSFVIVNLTAFMKVVGDLTVIQRASYRNERAIDFRSVQGGLSVYGAGTIVSGVLGTVPVAAPWATTAVYISFTRTAAAKVGIYLGILTLAIAPFSKALALLIAIPSPIVSAVYVIIFAMLFLEGAKTAFAGQFDQKKGAIIGLSMVMGLSAGAISGVLQGSASHLLSSSIVIGSMTALLLTVLTEFAGLRAQKLQVDLDRNALPEVDGFLCRFADKHSWNDEGKGRLRLVGEEVLLSLLDEEKEEAEGQRRRVTATIRPVAAAAELEIIVASGDAIEGNIENRMAYLDHSQGLDDEGQLSVRILRHYTSSVRHRKYHGIDIVSCRVEK